MFGDIAKTFDKTFIVAHFVPAVLFLSSQFALGALNQPPRWMSTMMSGAGATSISILFLVVAFAIALCMQGFQYFLIRILEGYYIAQLRYAGYVLVVAGILLFWTPYRTFNLIVQVAAVVAMGSSQYQTIALTQRKTKYQQRIASARVAKGIAEHDFTRTYPLDEGLVRATALGNIIRSFEHYPRAAYHLDPITMWPRLLAVIPTAFRNQLEASESNFLFIANLSLVLCVLAGESVVLALLHDPMLWVIAAGIAVAAFGLYRTSCTTAHQWGEYVRSAFDLYRLDLLKQWSVYLPSQPFTLADEQKIWARIQHISFYVRDPKDNLLFLSKSANKQKEEG